METERKKNLEAFIEEEFLLFRKSFLGIFKNLLLVISFFLGLYYIFLKNDRDLYLGISLSLLAPLLINLPIFAYKRITWVRTKYNINLLKFCIGTSLLFLILSASGAIYLWYIPIEFDLYVHFIENFLASFLIVLFISMYREKKKGSHLEAKRAGWLIFWFSIGIAVSWELYQFTCDMVFGTRTWFDPFQWILWDTTSDALLGIIGGTIGAFLIGKFFWNKILNYFKR